MLTKVFDLSQNPLTGVIPSEIGLLQRLEENFYVSADTDMTGTIPTQVCARGRVRLLRCFRRLTSSRLHISRGRQC